MLLKEILRLSKDMYPRANTPETGSNGKVWAPQHLLKSDSGDIWILRRNESLDLKVDQL